MLRAAVYFTVMFVCGAPAAAQDHGSGWSGSAGRRTSTVSVPDGAWKPDWNVSVPIDIERVRRHDEFVQRLSETLQEDSKRSPLLFPTIGLFIGAVAGYFVGRDNEPDTMFPAYLYTVPVGAAAGFVIGIMVEDITSQVEAEY